MALSEHDASEHDAHRRRGGRLIVGGAVVAVAFGVVGGFIGSSLTTSKSGSTSARVLRSTSCSVTTVANDDLPSIVTISVQGPTGGGGTGSGEVIRSGGYVLTNNHVVADAATGGSISVRLNDGTKVPATLVGRDPLTDVAVIKLDGGPKLRAIPIGNSTAVVIGQPVIVLGAPLGLSSTVTSGIISALDRTVAVPGAGTTTPSALLIDAMQTDAAINPGNSGGALVDCAGKFIGMPSAGASIPSSSGESSGGSIGLGFAIPANLAIKEAKELISTGHVTRAYLGLQAEPLLAQTSPTTVGAPGLLVTGVDRGSPAHSAGLRTGDVLTTITGKKAEDTEQLVAAVLEHRPGDVLTLGYDRNGSAHTAKVKLATEPATLP